jgi:hypothetical protein
MDWFDLALDRNMWQAFFNLVRNLENQGKFLGKL